MGERDHSITCDECGMQRGGINEYLCDCDLDAAPERARENRDAFARAVARQAEGDDSADINWPAFAKELSARLQDAQAERDALVAEREQTNTERQWLRDNIDSLRSALAAATSAREQAEGRVAEMEGALTKISAIRDSIVGMQGFNFSEHAYPLVAALDAVGFKGAGYEIARANLGTLVEQRDAAIRERDEARAAWDAGVAELTKASYAQVSLVMSRLHTVEAERDAARSDCERLARERDVAKARADQYLSTMETLEAAIAPRAAEVQRLTAECARMRPVYEASLELRRVESTDVPGDSIAELEANVPAAQRRSMVALTKWRTVLDTAATPGGDSTPDDPARCAVCGWPLAESVDKGCVRGNCSMRPRPERLYAPERAAREATAPGGDRE